MGTATYSNLFEGVAGAMRIRIGTVTMSSSYATSGDTLTVAALGMTEVAGFAVLGQPAGYVFNYDYTNKKVLGYWSAGFTPAGTNTKPTFTVEASGAIGTSMEIGLSADAATATAEGGTGITAQRALTTTSPVGTPTFTGTAVDAVALAQVASTTDLSAVSFRALVLGN